ncbi:hypothetical protein, partial [Haloquadratum walsbyi]|uniref:hypothetical protein n=1 Tax=Haloquadratum walsbyi TaxID=293091 RepID=UPI001AD8B08F
LSRLNAIPVRQPRTERVVPNGTTSESKPTGRNTRLTFFVRRPASDNITAYIGESADARCTTR